MKNILMIGTGGTIASKQTEYGLAPGLSAEDILNYIPAVSKICEVDSLQVCNLDSTNVTPEHWKLLAKTVQENYDRYDGFVICHGTDTLAYTGEETNPPALPISWPTLTASPAFTTGTAGIPMCIDMGMVTCAGVAIRSGAFPAVFLWCGSFTPFSFIMFRSLQSKFLGLSQRVVLKAL